MTLKGIPIPKLFYSSYSKNMSVRYDLYGVSNHSGTLYGGHYTAYCRHPYKKERWHLYNDRAVSGASPASVISYEAYLLFFERVDPPPQPVQQPDRPKSEEKEVEENDEEEEEVEDGDEEW